MQFFLLLDLIALGLSVSLSLSLTMIVGGAGIRRRLNLDFLLFALMEAVWAASSFVLRFSLFLSLGNPQRILEVATLTFTLMTPFLLLFIARYVRVPGPAPALAAGAIIVAIAGLSLPLFQGRLVSAPRILPGGITVYNISAWAIAAGTIPVACLVVSSLLLWVRRSKVQEPFIATSVLLLLGGFLAGGIIQVPIVIMSITNTVSVAILGWGIMRRHLFNPLRDLASDLRERAHTMDLIAQVGQKTTAILALDELLLQAVGLIRDTFEYFSVGILIVEGDELVLRASTLHSVHTLSKKFRLKIGSEGICGWVAASGKPLLVPDVSRDGRYVRCIEDLATRSELAVPILHGGIVLGVLDLQSARLNAFNERDLFTLQTVADQLSGAIENARLFQQAQRRAERLALVNRISAAVGAVLTLPELMETVYREVAPLFEADAFFIALYDRERGELDFRFQVDEGVRETPTREQVGEGLTSRVIASRKPLLANDLAHWTDGSPSPEAWGTGKMPSTWIGVPMNVGDRLIGVLSVQSYRPLHYGEEDLLLAATVADQVAVAIENARLYEELRGELVERRRTEEVLRESEEKFRNLAEQSPNMIFIWGNERVLYANNQCELLMGYSREEFYAPSFHFQSIAAPEYLHLVAAKYRAHMAGDEVSPYEYALLTKGGRRIDAIATTKLLRYEGAPAILGIITDITTRKRTERLLKALNTAALSMAQLLAPVEIFPVAVQELSQLGFASAIFLADPEKKNIALRCYGGSDSKAVFVAEDSEMGARWFPIDALPSLAQSMGGRRTILTELRPEIIARMRAPGGPLPPSFSAGGGPVRLIFAPLSFQEEILGMLAVVGGDIEAEEVEIFTAFAHQTAAAWRKTTLMQDLAASLAQLKRAQEQLLQAQKMEAIGRLAGGIAHDFNNLLTVISGYTNLLIDSLPGNAAALSDLEEIKNAIKRASTLTSRLLTFSKKQILQPAVLDLNRVVSDSLTLLRPLIGEDVEISVRLAAEPATVRADRHQFDQVLINLAVNARDAMPRGGKLALEISNIAVGAEGAPSALAPGAYVALRVQDTGVGMSEETREHIFEPFFTTKENGKGTGLGLSIVYGIITQAGGHVQVESALGRGSTFTILLPRAAGETKEAREERPAPSRGGTGTILLVEDDAVVRDLARRILKQGGYAVLAASSAREAIAIAEGQAAPNLVITDVVMPGGMNGVQLGERLARSCPGVPVLYMSGYTEDTSLLSAAVDKKLPFLAKPFQPSELLRKVEELLERSVSP
jgi:PAS domain S-box-containing protein